MKTHELAQELDRLARALRSLTPAASDAVAEKLELGRRRGYVPASKFEPRALTVAQCSEALAAATRRPSMSVELRKDVYHRRIEKNSTAFALLLKIAVANGHPAPAGERLSPRFTRLPTGVRSIGDALPRGDTALNADASAWEAAALRCLVNLAPAYSWPDIDRLARATYPANFRAECNLRDRIWSALHDWVSAHTIFLCAVDAAGMVLRINGVDPAPLIEVGQAVLAGNADPLGILKTP